MDRRRFKKIKRYFIIYISFSLLFTVILYFQVRYERIVEQQRMLALLQNHPEWEAEIVALWYKYENQGFSYTGLCRERSKHQLISHFRWPWHEGRADDSHMMEGSGQEEVTGQSENHGILQIIEEKYRHNIQCILPQKSFLTFWGAGMLAGAVLTVLLGYWEKHGKRRDFEFDETYQELCECLEQFQRGNFRQVPEYDDISEVQMNLWEAVKELGVYFEGLKKRLEEEEDSTKALITDISHQLKTPLASLRMSYELVNSDNITEEEKKEFQEQEAKEIGKLEILLGELVNLSRLERHLIQIKPMPASLKNTIADAVNQIYMKARNKKIEIQVEMEQDFEICHDGKWTAEALVNILDNAVKYSDEYTTITVRVQSLVKNVLIEVLDEGIGICQEELVRIYQRFYRGNEARERVKEGAGVGLYLSRMILERQGGTITAKRRVERGTAFRVTLPG